MKTAIAIFLLLAYVSSISSVQAQNGLDQRVSELSQQIASKMSAKQKTTIAIVEFTDLQGNVTDFGRYLAEELVTRLFDTEKFKVIERQLLSKIIAEQKLNLTGAIDPASAKQLGKLLGVDAIVSGTVSNLAQSLKVNARLIGTETGEVFSVASTEIFKDESVIGLLSGNSNNAPSTTKAPGSPVESSKAKRKVVADEFTFELYACRRTGQSVTCDFAIVSNSSVDRMFNLYNGNSSRSTTSSRLMVNTGNEHYPSEARLGSVTGTWLHISLSLVPQILVRASLRFESVNTDATSITLLRITFLRRGKQRGFNSEPVDYADFRNVPIE